MRHPQRRRRSTRASRRRAAFFYPWIRSPFAAAGPLFLRALVGQHRAELERLEGRLVALLVEELPQTGVVGILLVADLDRLAFGGEVVVGLRHVHGSHVP